jgi:glycosyltransferase involved in cell wall biosynthesis
LSLLAAFAGFLATPALYNFMTSKVFNRRYPLVDDPPFISVVMCALNESGFIEDALKSLEDQNIVLHYPSSFEFILVDSHSEDDTAAIAENYGWTVYQASKGKLNARHIGMEKAKGNIVVSVDADTWYPPNWINLMLRWFNLNDVVGVVGPRLVAPEEMGGWATAASIWLSLIDTGPLMLGGMRMPGQSVAFYRQAYFDVGGFDLTINQQNVHEMVREEEIKFALKLRGIGKVPVDWQAPVFTSARRLMFAGNGKKYEKWTKARLAGERF